MFVKKKKLYHLECRWRNSHVLCLSWPLTNRHLLGVASHLLSQHVYPIQLVLPLTSVEVRNTPHQHPIASRRWKLRLYVGRRQRSQAARRNEWHPKSPVPFEAMLGQSYKNGKTGTVEKDTPLKTNVTMENPHFQ